MAILVQMNSNRDPIYSTVTDLARLRGKSTLRPSMTANQ